MRIVLLRWSMALMVCIAAVVGTAHADDGCYEGCLPVYSGGVWQPYQVYYCNPMGLTPVQGNCHPSWAGCFECWSELKYAQDHGCFLVGPEIDEGEGQTCSDQTTVTTEFRTPVNCNYGTQTCNLGAVVQGVTFTTLCELCTVD